MKVAAPLLAFCVLFTACSRDAIGPTESFPVNVAIGVTADSVRVSRYAPNSGIRLVVGLEVAPLLGLEFWSLNRTALRCCQR